MPSLKEPILNIRGVPRRMNDIKPSQMDAWLKECADAFPIGKKFQVVMVDPPWKYKKAYEAIGTKLDGLAPYPTADIEALAALPVRKIMDTNAVLMIWTTSPMLFTCKRLFDAWRVKYSTVFMVWQKRQKDGVSPVKNVGWWTRSSVEFLLCGTVGSGWSKWKTSRSLKQEWPLRRQAAHSQKPQEIIDAVRDFLDVPNRIELFARTDVGTPDRKNWSFWGLESACGSQHYYCQSPGYLEGAALKAWKAEQRMNKHLPRTVKGGRRSGGLQMVEVELPKRMPASNRPFKIVQTGERFALKFI